MFLRQVNLHWNYAKQANEKANVGVRKVQNLKQGGEGEDLEILCSGNGVSIWLMPGMLRTVAARSQPLLNGL